jgi:hypothetical protein
MKFSTKIVGNYELVYLALFIDITKTTLMEGILGV